MSEASQEAIPAGRRRLTILFAMAGEAGHHTGTFRLARRLRDLGHRVSYLGIPDMEPVVAAQGFDFIPFAEDLLPRGYARRFAAERANPAPGLAAWWRRRVDDERFFQSYLSRIEDGSLDARLLQNRPDVILCDTLLWYVALRALRAGIPVVNLSIILATHANARIPPFIYSIRPEDTLWSRAQVRASWSWMRLSFLFKKRLASRVFGTFRQPTRMHHLIDEFERIAERSGRPCVEGETYVFTEVGPRLVLPEVMLCPRAFELPGSVEKGRIHVAEFVDDRRSEEPLAPGLIDEEKPLIVCSMGSSPGAYPHAQRFFEAVFEASRRRPDWQLVLHVSNRMSAVASLRAPENLLVREQIPQLTLLRSARAMVTHGGINSMMECTLAGVPMVVIPGARDQPGNAVRGVHHHLALTTSMATLTGEELVSLVAKAIDDPDLRRGLQRMREAIAEERGLPRAVAFIESQASPAHED